nr:ABC transporter ATP-binding protein [Phytoactinopolyspora mesophila]
MVQRQLARFVSYAKLPLALTVFFGIAASGAAVAAGFALVDVVRRIFADGSSGVSGVYGPLALAAIMTVLRLVLLWARDQCATWTAARVKVRVRARLVERVFDLGPGHLVRRRVGDVQATLVDGVEAIQAYVGFYLPQAVIALVVPGALVAFLVTLDPWVALVVVVGVIVVPFARQMWRKLLGVRGQAHWGMYAEYSAKTTDALQGMTTLVALGAARRHGEALAEEAERLRLATTRSLGASLGVYTVTSAAMGLGTGIAVVIAALRHATGALDATAVLLVLFLSAECFRPLSDLQNYWHEGFYGMAAANGIYALLEAQPDVKDAPDVRPRDIASPPSITLEDVTFSYPESDRLALDRMSVELAAGSTLALVGRSGAGKSTVVQLLQRVFDPKSGSIRIDGTDLRALPLDQLRSLIGVVSQDVVLFHGSISENIRLAKADVTDAELMQVIRAARLDDVVERLPEGLDTQVGERGARLSGGERQRVAIARALLRDAPILVLDEATSSLDGENEAAVAAALQELRHGRTTVVVAHRLSTVADADVVVVLEAGRIAESGAPAELMRARGAWRDLVHAQAEGVVGS